MWGEAFGGLTWASCRHTRGLEGNTPSAGRGCGAPCGAVSPWPGGLRMFERPHGAEQACPLDRAPHQCLRAEPVANPYLGQFRPFGVGDVAHSWRMELSNGAGLTARHDGPQVPTGTGPRPDLHGVGGKCGHARARSRGERTRRMLFFDIPGQRRECRALPLSEKDKPASLPTGQPHPLRLSRTQPMSVHDGRRGLDSVGNTPRQTAHEPPFHVKHRARSGRESLEGISVSPQRRRLGLNHDGVLPG